MPKARKAAKPPAPIPRETPAGIAEHDQKKGTNVRPEAAKREGLDEETLGSYRSNAQALVGFYCMALHGVEPDNPDVEVASLMSDHHKGLLRWPTTSFADNDPGSNFLIFRFIEAVVGNDSKAIHRIAESVKRFHARMISDPAGGAWFRYEGPIRLLVADYVAVNGPPKTTAETKEIMEAAGRTIHKDDLREVRRWHKALGGRPKAPGRPREPKNGKPALAEVARRVPAGWESLTVKERIAVLKKAHS
jgi:hypothetical protein